MIKRLSTNTTATTGSIASTPAAATSELSLWKVVLTSEDAGLTSRGPRSREVLARLVTDREVPASELDAGAVTRLGKAGLVRRELRPRRWDRADEAAGGVDGGDEGDAHGP